jgi:hypothetical protein
MPGLRRAYAVDAVEGSRYPFRNVGEYPLRSVVIPAA